MKLFKSTIAVLFVALGLLTQTANPAHALGIGDGVAVVTVSVSAGLGYPVLFPPQPSVGFTVTSTVACAAVEVSVKAPKPPVNGGTCTVNASGILNQSNCGLSTGTVSGSVTLNGALGNNTISFTGAVQTAGSAVVISGTATKSSGQSGPFVFVGDATPVPTPGGPSCSTGNQTDFIVAGAFGAIVL